MRHMRASLVVTLCLVAALVLAACQTAAPTSAPAEGVPSAAALPTEAAPAAAGVPPDCADNADYKACAVFKPGETIKIGFGGPMTGDNSAFGIDISNAGKLAVQDAGQFEGHSFELDVQDDMGTGEGGAAVANKFVSDPAVVAIAGHTFSPSTASAIPIYVKGRVPMLSGSATRADLTQGEQDVFNRIAFTDDVQGTNIANYLYDELGKRSLAIMHDGDAYGMGLAEKVRDVFTTKGGQVVAFEAITKGEADYSAPLNKISAAKPDALFYGGYVGEGAVIKNQMEVAGLKDVAFFSDDGVYGAKFLELTGEKGEGAYATSLVPPASPEKDAFEATYQTTYGSKAGELSAFTWHGYDIVAALIDVVKNTAVVADDGNLYVPRDKLVKAVRTLAGYQGITGTITCDSVGECNTVGPTFYVVQDGAWTLAQ